MLVEPTSSTFPALEGGPDEKMSPLHLVWIYYQMDHRNFALLGCFSHFSLNQLSIPVDLLNHLSLLKFDSDDRTSVTKHIYDFLHLWKSREIDSEELVSMLLFLTLEGCANWWCHTLPSPSIHSLLTPPKELHPTFDKYNHQDVHEKFSHLRMKPRESVEDFAILFLHLCNEIPE